MFVQMIVARFLNTNSSNRHFIDCNRKVITLQRTREAFKSNQGILSLSLRTWDARRSRR